jgi:protein TonB
MESKKKPELELSRKYTLFLNVGFIFSLSVCLLAFEWKTYPVLSGDKDTKLYFPADDFVLVDIPLIPPVVPPPAPPAAPPTEQIEHLSNIVETSLSPDELLPLPDVPETIPSSGDFVDNTVPEEEVVEPVLDIYMLEKEPEGREAFYAYISKHLKYPKAAQQAQAEGKVFVQFVINQDGSISDVQVIKGLGFGMDEEAIRVIQQAPKWVPGKQRGKPVKVRMALPIVFKLR